MQWLLYLCGGLLGLFLLVMVWGYLHLRHSQRRAREEIAKVELADIERLAAECVSVFQQKLSIHLEPADWEATARGLDHAYGHEPALKRAFAREDFYWYFVLPVGA